MYGFVIHDADLGQSTWRAVLLQILLDLTKVSSCMFDFGSEAKRVKLVHAVVRAARTIGSHRYSQV